MQLLGWGLLAVSLAYAGVIHHGVGASGDAAIVHWWQPRGFFFTYESLDPILADPTLALVLLALPAFLLFVGVAVATRSALAATLALACVVFVMLCCFYGLGERRRAIWGFFGWRGSGVMLLFSLAIAAALLAPFLARRWLERGWPARIALYLPAALLVMVAIRDVTGTDPSLPFAISPWPIVSLFGIEIGGAAVAAALGMLGMGLAAVGLLRQGRFGAGMACGLLSVAIPAGSLGLGLQLDTAILSLVVAATALLILLAPDDGSARKERTRLLGAARPLAVGAALVALPILGGQLLVDYDYDATRNHAARKILDALASYHQRESVYPDSLEELVTSKDLDAIPEPEIGFGAMTEPGFLYQNFGTNYLLEFSAPRWVQCAYNPPYPDDSDDDSLAAVGSSTTPPGAAAAAGDGEDEDGGGAGSWSCPAKPPELW